MHWTLSFYREGLRLLLHSNARVPLCISITIELEEFVPNIGKTTGPKIDRVLPQIQVKSLLHF